MSRKLISIVCPVLNEEEYLPIFYNHVSSLIEKWELDYDFEFIFTDNCSSDRTFSILQELAQKDPRVRYFRFSKNFGYQGSILTGYLKSRGAAAVQLDVDLQDPPELVPEFIKHWEQGNRVVYGVRTQRKEAWHLNFIRKVFYRLMTFLSDGEIPADAGDFRLIDRKVIDQLKFLDPGFLYIRGAIAQMGFKQIGIEYERDERKFGVSKFPMIQLIRLAINGLLIHSTIPLRFSAYFGVTLSAATIIGAVIYILLKIFVGNNWPAGFTTIIVFMLISLAINSLFLGILGEYVGRLYRQRNSIQNVIIDESNSD